jgi:hypothetical protein
MAWLSQFKLGVVGAEYTFDLNPASMVETSGPVQILNENLAGDYRKDIVKNYRPSVQINSNYLTLTQRQQFISLLGLPVMLGFQTRDDWTFFEQDTPDTVNQVTIRSNSITSYDVALAAISGTQILTITGVFTTAALTGTNYYTGGSYNHTTRAITLGTPLASATTDIFVQYTYKGFYVTGNPLSSTAQGGWVDKFQYDFELLGV